MKLIYILPRLAERKSLALLLYALAALFFVLFLSFTTSPLFDNEGADSGMFKTFGLGLLEGKVPYRDLFDQKGPILWFVQAFCLWLSWDFGHTVVQFLSLTVTFCLFHQLASLFVGKAKAVCSVLFILLPLASFIHGGNQTEEWMLPWITWAYLLSFRFLLKGGDARRVKIYGLVYGLCFGVVFLLRVNDGLAQPGCVIFGVFLFLLYKRRYADSVWHAAMSLLGFIVVLTPVLAYYAANDALGDLHYGMFGFSMSYSGGVTGFLGLLINTYKMRYALLPMAAVVMYALRHHRRTLAFVIVPAALLTYFSLGPAICCRYPAISTIPLFVVCVAYVMRSMGRIWASKKRIATLFLLLFLFCQQSLWIVAKESYCMLYLYKDVCPTFYAETDKLLGHIPAAERGDVWNYNLGANHLDDIFSDPFPAFNTVFFHAGFTQCNKLVLFSQAAFDPSLTSGEERDFARRKPKWVVRADKATYVIDSIERELAEHYTMVAHTDPACCDISLYRRVE